MRHSSRRRSETPTVCRSPTSKTTARVICLCIMTVARCASPNRFLCCVCVGGDVICLINYTDVICCGRVSKPLADHLFQFQFAGRIRMTFKCHICHSLPFTNSVINGGKFRFLHQIYQYRLETGVCNRTTSQESNYLPVCCRKSGYTPAGVNIQSKSPLISCFCFWFHLTAQYIKLTQ